MTTIPTRPHARPLPFHDVSFPLRIAFGASGGPERTNEIVALSNGGEQRNARRAHARRRWDAGTGVRSLDDLREVVAFFEARRGSLTAFRFADPLDDRLDGEIGRGDGATRAFRLVRTYGEGADAYARPISHPRPGTVEVRVDGEPAIAAIDHTTGSIELGEAPADGASIEARCRFDVPVRFDCEQLVVSIAAHEAGEAPSIPLVEVREGRP